MKEILLSLVVWISQHSGFVYDGQTLPNVKHVSNQELANIMFAGNVPAGYDEYGLMALYNNHNRTIYVTDTIDLDTDYGQSVLLHELVHYLQFEGGHNHQAMCLRSLEKSAYDLQNAYLVNKGYRAPFDNMHIFFKSLCDNGTL